MSTVWSDLHQKYKGDDWIDKPSIFAETAIQYFPKSGKILDLGAGQGQDSRFFAEHSYSVTSTDLEESALELSRSKLPQEMKSQVAVQKIDLRDELPYETDSYDVVYAHLSLHYFDTETTKRLFNEIERVLKPDGILAFLVNSAHDPEYQTGKKIEEDYFQIDQTAKRYFSTDSARHFTKYFDIVLLDDLGETYKDAAKDVHNLVRFVGKKSADAHIYKSALPFVGAIVERLHDGTKELLLQTRWKPISDPVYSGTLEFPAGRLDEAYESVFDTISREIREEAGLTLKAIKNDDRTEIYSPKQTDKIVGFRPFCCTQQLQDGKPWVGFIFVVEVEDGELTSQLSEAKDAKWVAVSEVEDLFRNHPEQLFGLELPAWDYYFNS